MTKPSQVTNRWKGAGRFVIAACLIFFPFVAGQAQQQLPAANLARNRHWQQIEWFYQQRAYPLAHIPAATVSSAPVGFEEKR